MMMKSSLLAVAVAFSLGGTALASEWDIDTAHTTAQFSVRHMMVSTVRGVFDKVSGVVHLDDADLTKSSVDVTIDAGTVNTRNPKRDGHLKSPDFFDVAKHPTITFKSTKIEKGAGAKFKVTGDLNIRGVSHPVTLTVEGPTAAMKTPWGGSVRGVSASGTINRKDWGLTWNKALEAGGVVVGDEVQLQIDAENRQQARRRPGRCDQEVARREWPASARACYVKRVVSTPSEPTSHCPPASASLVAPVIRHWLERAAPLALRIYVPVALALTLVFLLIGIPKWTEAFTVHPYDGILDWSAARAFWDGQNPSAPSGSRRPSFPSWDIRRPAPSGCCPSPASSCPR